jgi:hypothetical protein
MGYQPLLNRPSNSDLDVTVYPHKPKKAKGKPKQDHPATFADSLLSGKIIEQEQRYPLPAIDIRLISEDSR